VTRRLFAAQLLLQPFVDKRDNRLEMACLVVILYTFFVSVLPNAGFADATVAALQAAIVAYALYRFVAARRSDADGTASGSPEPEDSEADVLPRGGGSGGHRDSAASRSERSRQLQLVAPLLAVEDPVDASAAGSVPGVAPALA
jgi:hypothetical protein